VVVDLLQQEHQMVFVVNRTQVVVVLVLKMMLSPQQ
jgi:hypothetical protein